MRSSILAVAAIAGISISINAFADEITLVADTWCPYNCDPASASPGFMVEIAKKAFEAKGHKIKYTVGPWARALADGREGKITGVIGAGQAESDGFDVGTEMIGQSSNCFFVAKGAKWKFDGVKSLSSVTSGGISGYSYTPEIDAYFADAKNASKVQMMSGDDALEKSLKKVAAGRMDAFVEDANVANYTSKSLNIADKIQKAGCATALPITVGFSKKIPKAKEYSKILGDYYASIKKSGALDALKKKYSME